LTIDNSPDSLTLEGAAKPKDNSQFLRRFALQALRGYVIDN